MIDTKELRRLAQEQEWIGRWYDAGCETLMAERNGEHEEVAHPIPIGLVPYLIAVQPASILELLDRLEAAESSAAWHQRRWMALQMHQKKMREPERTIVCDILANGELMHPTIAGDRYATKDAMEESK